MASKRSTSEPEAKGFNRRAFLKTTGGVATGVAVSVAPSAAVALGLPAAAGAKAALGHAVDRSGDVPAEPVMAYIHDAEKGHVTVMSGTVERTYHDPVLVQRLLAAAHSPNA